MNQNYTSKEEFYLNITSDNNEIIFPHNKVSDFRVRLAHPIYLDHLQWKVGLASFHYPYEFANIGEKTSLKFYVDNKIEDIILPEWFCDNLYDLTQYLSEIITYRLKSLKPSLYTTHFEKKRKVVNIQKPLETIGRSLSHLATPGLFPSIPQSHNDHEKFIIQKVENKTGPFFSMTLAPLRRVKITTNIPDFDIGFSDQLLEILGFQKLNHFSYENFDARVNIKQALFSNKSNRLTPLYKHWHDFLVEMKSDYSLDNLYNKLDPIKFLSWTIVALKLLTYDHNLDVLFQTQIPTPENPNVWLEHSSYWKQYFSIDNVKDIIKESIERDAKLNEQKQMYTSHTSNSTLLFGLMLIKKLIKEQILLSDTYSELPGSIVPFEMMYVYSDLVKPEPFNSIMSRLLAIVKTEGTPGQISVYSPRIIQYKKVEKLDISDFKVLIASAKGELIPFMRGPSGLTLHFIRI